MGATTFKKSLNWGGEAKASYAKFKVTGYVLGDGQVREDWTHEFLNFGVTGDVPLRPTGKGTVNFEIAAEYVLARKFSGGTIEDHRGKFGYRYWITYDFREGDKDPLTLDYHDLALGKDLHERPTMVEKGPGLFRLVDVELANASATGGYPPYFMIKPRFEVATVSTTRGAEYVVSHEKTTNPPNSDPGWGHLRLDLHVPKLQLRPIKVPKVPPKLIDPTVLFCIVPIEKENQRELSADGQTIATDWKRKLFLKYPELEEAIENRKITVYFYGYASKSGSDAYNYDISTDRAKAAIDYLRPQLGSAGDYRMKSFGEEKARWDYDARLKKIPKGSDRIVIVYVRADDASRVVNQPTTR